MTLYACAQAGMTCIRWHSCLVAIRVFQPRCCASPEKPPTGGRVRRTKHLRKAGQCGHQAQPGLPRMARGPRTNVHAFVAAFGASAETPEPSSEDKANTSLPRATPGAGRPSAGGRLTCGCSRARSSSPPSPRVLARWPKKQSLVPPRSARAPGPHFCSAVAAPSPWASAA